MAMRLLSPSLLAPDEGTETDASKPSQNPGASISANPTLPDWMPLSPDRLTHIGWACACPLGRVVLKRNHPRIPPGSESWTADEPPPQFGPGACQRASASITSKPLFIIVAESMVMRFPMRQ